MDKIDKFLNKLATKQREEINETVEKILKRDFNGLDFKKLQGENKLFRVRKGKIRIVFFQEGDFVEIFDIQNRSDNTYR